MLCPSGEKVGMASLPAFNVSRSGGPAIGMESRDGPTASGGISWVQAARARRMRVLHRNGIDGPSGRWIPDSTRIMTFYARGGAQKPAPRRPSAYRNDTRLYRFRVPPPQ